MQNFLMLLTFLKLHKSRDCSLSYKSSLGFGDRKRPTATCGSKKINFQVTSNSGYDRDDAP